MTTDLVRLCEKARNKRTKVIKRTRTGMRLSVHVFCVFVREHEEQENKSNKEDEKRNM